MNLEKASIINITENEQMATGPEHRVCLLIKLYQYFSFLVFVFQTKQLSRENSLLSESTEAIGILLCVGIFLIRALQYVLFFS